MLYFYYLLLLFVVCFFFFKQKTAYEMRISDWSSDVCSSDLVSAPNLTADPCVEALAGLGLLGVAIERLHDVLIELELVWAGPLVGPVRVRARVLNVQVNAVERVEIGRASCRESVCQYV